MPHATYHAESKYYRIIALCNIRKESADTHYKRAIYAYVAETLTETMSVSFFDINDDQMVIMALWGCVASLVDLIEELDEEDAEFDDQLDGLHEVLSEITAIIAIYKPR